MPFHRLEPVNHETYRLIRFGCKSLEVRVGLGQIKRVKTGDEVAFECHEADVYDVVRVARYRTFKGMLAQENHNKIMPGLRQSDVYDHLRDRSTRLAEILFGVYVLELRISDRQSTRLNC
jgi:ASC-1-like (ASCH) protein